MLLKLKEIDKLKVGDFRFKSFGDNYLLTNEVGEHCFLDLRSFQSFLSGDREHIAPYIVDELQNKGFIRDHLDFQRLSQKYASRHASLSLGTSLHIVVVTLRCDHRCSYCQTSSKGQTEKSWDMDMVIAQKVVDTIFETPNKNIMIEFQGGEPLLNFQIIKFIIQYAKEKNKRYNKNLRFSLVSNFTYMDEEKLDYLIKNDLSLCTSLDGPEELHNKNRVSTIKGINSYQNTIKWLKILNKKKKKGQYKYKVNALSTITKHSLKYPKEIVDEFMKLNLENIFLRPVAPFGIYKEKKWKKLSFSSVEFMVFYRRALDYIIECNMKGRRFFEKTAQIFLFKILTDKDPQFLDMRSPCGGGIGQLCYNFNGNVYICDEARMLSSRQDESFRIGNVLKNKFSELIDNKIVKSICFASCLDNLPKCNDCVYKPYCGVCPLYNYVIEGDLFIKFSKEAKCYIYSSILDYLFDKLQTPAREVFEKWVGIR